MPSAIFIEVAPVPEIDMHAYPLIVWTLHGATCLAELAGHPSTAIERVSSEHCSQLGFTGGFSNATGGGLLVVVPCSRASPCPPRRGEKQASCIDLAA